MEQLPRQRASAILTWALAGVLAVLLAVGALLALERVARRRQWRLGPWSQRWTRNKQWRITTRWGVARIHGGCEACGTSWRYVDPHPLGVNPYGQMAILFPFCTACHDETPLMAREDLYKDWWVRRREAIIDEGQIAAPDIREWQEIRMALGVESNPYRYAGMY